MQYDEYGKERDISDFLKEDIYLAGATAEEYSPQLDKIMDEVDIQRPVRVFDKEGNNAWGVELRVASREGKRIIYLINLNRHDVEITLRIEKGGKNAKDLVNNREMDISGPFVLKPRKPMLLETR